MSAVWQIIRTQYRHDRLAFLLGILVSLIPAAAGLLLLGVSGWFITAAALAGLSGAFLNIFGPSAIIRALAIMRTGGRYGERLLTHEATFRFLAHLRNQVFAGFTRHRRRGDRSASLLNRLTVDISALDQVYLRLAVPIAVALAAVIAMVLWWATISATVLAAGLILLGLWAALIVTFVRYPERQNARRSDAALEAMRLRAADLVSGRRDLSIYGGLEGAAQAVAKADRRLQVAEEAEEKRALRLVLLSGLMGQVSLAVFLVIAVAGVAAGDFGVAFAAGLVLVVLALPEVVNLLLPGLTRLPRIALAARRAGHLASGPQGSSRQGERLSGPAETVVADSVLAFRSVSFRYPGALRDVVTGTSFQIKPGEVLALAGKSGCGKSTLAGLAARLLTPDSGRILLDGKALSGWADRDLRQKVTVLGQRPYLFNDTVAVNLRIAKPEASDAELWAALEKASLVERIASGANGLHTVLGEGGMGLSGGEQRRLALARAFLTRPQLFILDEMTEGLDEETAEEVLDRFFACRGAAAVLMIAHKKRELARADGVLTLD